MTDPTAWPACDSGVAGAPQARGEAEPILYSFRRCPYAIRARLALAAAGMRPGVDLQLREVALKAKPPELLATSAKGTVPVLVLGEGSTGPTVQTSNGGLAADEALAHPVAEQAEPPGAVLDESLLIMRWALRRQDPHGWLEGWSEAERARMEDLIAVNDGPFRHHLDRFKYAGRYGEEGLDEREEHRLQGLALLRDWNRRLQAGGWLLGSRPCLADGALLPFVRQFRLADPQRFDADINLEALQGWLQRFLHAADLQAVMQSPWAERSAWRSPSWLYHLALRQDWQAARDAGVYRVSTRGRTLEQVGFVHLSQAHQVAATADRFYGDVPAGELLLLTIAPGRLRAEGLEVRLEPAPGSGELFPHLHGPLPLRAVLLAEPLERARVLPPSDPQRASEDPGP